LGTARLLAMVTEDSEDGAVLLAALKRDLGAVGLESLLTEITKLNDVRKLGLPEGLLADCSEKMVAAWRARAIKMYPSDFRDTAEDVRITLLAALCSSRQAEITDALVELLVALVHKINARAERRVEKQLTAELKKVRGKEGILFKLADAAIGKPDEAVRTALYPSCCPPTRCWGIGSRRSSRGCGGGGRPRRAGARSGTRSGRRRSADWAGFTETSDRHLHCGRRLRLGRGHRCWRFPESTQRCGSSGAARANAGSSQPMEEMPPSPPSRASSSSSQCSAAHRHAAASGSSMLRPSGVSAYSTRSFGSACTVRDTNPFRSKPRSDWVSAFGVTRRSGTRSSEYLRGPSSRQRRTMGAHLSPKRKGSSEEGHSSSKKSGGSGGRCVIEGLPSPVLVSSW
jgi:hypothetical protein